VIIGDSNIGFNVPHYGETDTSCPAVQDIKIYEKDCKTISKAFKNSNGLISSISDGFLFAELAD
jgi:hypothetical protein